MKSVEEKETIDGKKESIEKRDKKILHSIENVARIEKVITRNLKSLFTKINLFLLFNNLQLAVNFYFLIDSMHIIAI